MTTLMSLTKAAFILGVSLCEARRLVRERRLPVACVRDRVRYVEASDLLAFIRAGYRPPAR